MASVSDLTMSIEVVDDGPAIEAIVTVEYDIDFSSYDQNSNQPYAEVCRLIGDDTSLTPLEDGADDRIADGRRFPVILAPAPGQVASNGQPSIHRTRTKRLKLPDLNEDATGTHELRAVVTLTPAPPGRLS